MVYKVEPFTITYTKGQQRWTVKDPSHYVDRFVSVDKDNHGYSNKMKFEGMTQDNSGYCVNLFNQDTTKITELRENNRSLLTEIKGNSDTPPSGVKNVFLFKRKDEPFKNRGHTKL